MWLLGFFLRQLVWDKNLSLPFLWNPSFPTTTTAVFPFKEFHLFFTRISHCPHFALHFQISSKSISSHQSSLSVHSHLNFLPSIISLSSLSSAPTFCSFPRLAALGVEASELRSRDLPHTWEVKTQQPSGITYLMKRIIVLDTQGHSIICSFSWDGE